eukprot:12922715-Prorocentrum_lima.AAC.1
MQFGRPPKRMEFWPKRMQFGMSAKADGILAKADAILEGPPKRMQFGGCGQGGCTFAGEKVPRLKMPP